MAVAKLGIPQACQASLQPMLFNLFTQARQALLAQAEGGYCTQTTDKFEKYAIKINFGTRAKPYNMEPSVDTGCDWRESCWLWANLNMQ